MTISDMHILFRTIGQQMGLQQVRGILPESIDNFLNVAIVEKCRSILIENTSIPQQDVINQRNGYFSAVNSLRTLYRIKNISIPYTVSTLSIDNPFKVAIVGSGILSDDELFEIIAFTCKINNKLKNCRIVEHDRIANVLNDYCNRPDNDYPVITLHSVKTTQGITIYATIYIEDYSKLTELNFHYIQSPKKVSYTNNVDCDLPEYLHNEIVQIAVNKFFTAVGSTTHNVKQ